MNQPSLELSAFELHAVRTILSRVVPEIEVWAFGSRVAGSARKFSDLDLALLTREPLPLGRLAELRAAFEDSDLPIRVDLADWAATDAGFRERIRMRHVVVQPAPQPRVAASTG